MLALLTSALVVAYLVIPGLIFQWIFRIFVPVKVFDRSSTREQLTYSVVVCFLPLVATLLLIRASGFGQYLPPWSFPDTAAQADLDHKMVLLACFDDSFVPKDGEALWTAATRSSRRQGKLLAWHFCFVSLEALLLGLTASRWGRLHAWLKAKNRMTLSRRLSKVLLPNVSDWHVLLSDFMFPGKQMHVDVMTKDDRLYDGDVLDYTRDREGRLVGIYLSGARRYDRKKQMDDREKGREKHPDEYWKLIQGEHLYVFADSIGTLNVRPRTPAPEVEAEKKKLALELGQELKQAVTIEAVAPPAVAPSANSKAVSPTG